MTYSEENSALAYERHPDTHPKQHRVWKTRGSIPDRYFDDNRQVRKRVQELAPVEEKRQDRLALVLASEKINATKVFELSGLKAEKWLITDFIKGKVMLSDAERVSLTTEVQKLRAEIRNGLSLAPGFPRRKKLGALGRDVRLIKRPTFGPELGGMLAPARPASPDAFTTAQLEVLEQQLALFLLETGL